MNEKLKALKALFETKSKERDIILAKGAEVTREDIAAAKALNDELKALRSEIDDLEEVIRDAVPVSTPDPVAPGVQWEEPAGVTTLGLTDGGAARILDEVGYGVSARQFRAISEPGYKRAFRALFANRADDADRRALQEGLDDFGGYLVPPDIQAQIIGRRANDSNVLGLVNTITTQRDRVVWPKVNYTDSDDIYDSPIRIDWTGETGPSGTQDLVWGQIEIPVYTGSFQIHVHRDLMEDQSIGLDEILARFAGTAYRLGMEDVTLGGDGVKKPKGILFSVGGVGEPPTTNVGNPTTADKLIDWIYSVPEQYAENAWVVLNRATYALWAQLKDDADHYVGWLMDNTAGGLARPRLQTLLGYPVRKTPFMPTPGSGKNVAIFGQFNEGYTHVTRVGMSVEVFGLQDKAMLRENKVGWHFRFRAGGAVTQERALRVAVQS